jgi:hypothetical protein
VDKVALAKVWTVVHLFAIYTGANSILILQNSPALLPLVITTKDEAARGRISMAVFWFFIAATSLIVSMSLVLAYKRQSAASSSCVEATPAMFAITLVPRTKLALCYQLFWLVVCTAVAVYGVGHGCRTILESPLYECDAGSPNKGSLVRDGGSLFQGVLPTFQGKDLRFDGCGITSPTNGGVATPNPHGIEYVPLVEDVVVALLALAAMTLVAAFWIAWVVHCIRRHRVSDPTG